MRLSNTMMINETLLPTGKRAFTLAEVLITLSILGVVAALTIPTLVNRQSDLAAQVRIKKAISAYEDVIGIYMAENEVGNAVNMLKSGDPLANDCSQARNYFKATNTPTANGNDCQFVTADGTAWSIDMGTGNATVIDTDRAGQGRYAVTMWNANNRVNTNGTANGGVANTPAAVYGTLNGSLINGRNLTPAIDFMEGTYSCANGAAAKGGNNNNDIICPAAAAPANP